MGLYISQVACMLPSCYTGLWTPDGMQRPSDVVPGFAGLVSPPHSVRVGFSWRGRDGVLTFCRGEDWVRLLSTPAPAAPR